MGGRFDDGPGGGGLGGVVVIEGMFVSSRMSVSSGVVVSSWRERTGMLDDILGWSFDGRWRAWGRPRRPPRRFD